MKKYFAAAVLLMTMAACGGADKTLESTTWKLSDMVGIPAGSINHNADFFTLEFNADEMMVAGRTNCNRFFGKYELKGRELEFGDLGMTRMACPEMEYEKAFTEMLDEVDSFKIKGSELTLFDDGKVLAVFKAVEKPVQAE
ncbi:META domain-containing protein [uncultured Alistipes sp.]|jgi:heat shock protein|uniref:META domain-containing protein n=1 Tax=uncultured Alistipes sp. TaxID=538949 RepID=UPI0025FFB41A|nr:META domain-containing protein [uncultured Alistipes sp.]